MNALLKLRRRVADDLKHAEFFTTNPTYLPTRSTSHRHFVRGKAAALKQVLARIDGHIHSAHDKKHDRRKHT